MSPIPISKNNPVLAHGAAPGWGFCFVNFLYIIVSVTTRINAPQGSQWPIPAIHLMHSHGTQKFNLLPVASFVHGLQIGAIQMDQLDEFERRAQQLGKQHPSKPEVAFLLGISNMTFWKWSRRVPESMPNWSRAGGVNFMNIDEAISWCQEFAKKHPDMMERRSLPAEDQ